MTGEVAGQPVAFEAFFEAERVRLQRALYLLTGNVEEAEEVLQESFIALWERWDRVGAMDDPTGYLYRTALNRYRSRMRRVGRAARLAIGQAHGRDGFAEAEDRVEIARALAALSPRRREAIVSDRTVGVRLGGSRPDHGRRRRHRSTPGAGRPRRPTSHFGGPRCLTFATTWGGSPTSSASRGGWMTSQRRVGGASAADAPRA